MFELPVVFHFGVSFGLLSIFVDNRFQEVSGMSGEVGVEELREGGLNEYPHRLPMGVKYGNLVLKRGYVTGSEVREWCRKAIEEFSFEPREVQVALLNEEHLPLFVWSFVNAYPVKWSISDFKAQENALAIESMELAYSSFRRVLL